MMETQNSYCRRGCQMISYNFADNRLCWHLQFPMLTPASGNCSNVTTMYWLILKKWKNRSLSHPLGHLGVMNALHLWLVGKPVVDFIFVVIELFSLPPMVETLWAEIGRSRRFSKGAGHFERDFIGKGHRPQTIVGVRKVEWLPFRVVSKYAQSII